MLSNAEMNAASGQVREIAAAMTRAMNELALPTSWSGADSEQFQRQWNDLVHARLMAAANKLDGISFRELTDALDG